MQKELFNIRRKGIKGNYTSEKCTLLIAAFFLSIIPASGQDTIKKIEHQAKTYIGESFNFDGKAIRFKEVVSDSRCPSDVTCVWAGEAKILIEIFKKGKLIGEEIISTRAHNFSLSNFLQGNFSINGLVLSPYPKTSRKIKTSDYQLQFRVTEMVRY